MLLTEIYRKLDCTNMYFEDWYEIVKKNMKNEPTFDSNDPKVLKAADRCFNSYYTPDEFEEEWLDIKGLL